MQNNILENPIFEQIKINKIKFLPFLKTKQYILRETGSPVRKETFHFDKSQLSEWVNLLSKQGFKDAKPIDTVSGHVNCYLEVAFSDDRQFAAVQLYEYIPFAFQPVRELFLYKGSTAMDLLSYLDRCKKKG